MRRHLSAEELLDVVEGWPTPESVAHLRGCDACRSTALGLSETICAVTEASVPEPSPLFWDHLSSRVREAVAAEPPAVGAGVGTMRPWRWLVWPTAAGVAAAAVIVAVVVGRRPALAPKPLPPAVVLQLEVEESVLADDESLMLLADLADDLEWEAAAEAGLTVAQGATDRAVADLSEPERAALQQMLADALAGNAPAL